MSIKNRRSIRCSLCTPYRWLGNSQKQGGRMTSQEARRQKEDRQEMRDIKKTHGKDHD
jgi:hypothetical protein